LKIFKFCVKLEGTAKPAVALDLAQDFGPRKNEPKGLRLGREVIGGIGVAPVFPAYGASGELGVFAVCRELSGGHLGFLFGSGVFSKQRTTQPGVGGLLRNR
jgi:hypothetical protein